MADKFYFNVRKFAGDLVDVPGLNAKIAALFKDSCVDLEEDENFEGFVRVCNGDIEFWQNCAGEDSFEGYGQNFRVFVSELQFCRLLAGHLTGEIKVEVDGPEGSDYYIVTPGKAQIYDPFA